jgi:8-oxo-dGTP pyrophosphatase MutT (NUDIX family)
MTHIHTGANQHDITASAFIVRMDDAEPRVMLHQHRLLNKMMQFGGHVELDEHPWEAVAREIREETGYDFDQLEVLVLPGAMPHLPQPALLIPQPLYILDVPFYGASPAHFHDDIAWAFVAKAPPRHALAPGESEDIVLYGRGELVALPDNKIISNVRETALFVFDTCLPTWNAVPARPL